MVERNEKKKALRIQLDKRNTGAIKQMTTRGMTKQVFSIHPFALDESLCSFTSEVQGLKPKHVSKKKQHEGVLKTLENPFYGPYLCCIAGKPNDMQAKLFAAHIMMNAVLAHGDKDASAKQKKKLKGRGLPLWHTLVGGFDNPVISNKHNGDIDHPSMLIISNITMESSASKIEKLRDILEVHSNIPRIVVVAGTDPLTFFNTKMHMSLTSCMFLTSNLVKKAVEL